MHKYKIRYELALEDRDGGYTKEEADEKGLTDGLLLFSILFPDNGSYSQATVINYNGVEKRAFTQDEIFKIWMSLGLSLHDNDELEGWKREFIKMYAGHIREIFKNK